MDSSRTEKSEKQAVSGGVHVWDSREPPFIQFAHKVHLKRRMPN
ncbi:hypothetical protein [Pseudomonas syringae group genomosp. 3]|nr:hypothetical protein [Pseudomonas syringae group genomosp. 3]